MFTASLQRAQEFTSKACNGHLNFWLMMWVLSGKLKAFHLLRLSSKYCRCWSNTGPEELLLSTSGFLKVFVRYLTSIFSAAEYEEIPAFFEANNNAFRWLIPVHFASFTCEPNSSYMHLMKLFILPCLLWGWSRSWYFFYRLVNGSFSFFFFS